MMPFNIIGGQGNNVNKFMSGGFIASTLNQKNIPSSVAFSCSLADKVVVNSSTLLLNVYGSSFAIWQEAQNQFASQPQSSFLQVCSQLTAQAMVYSYLSQQ